MRIFQLTVCLLSLLSEPGVSTTLAASVQYGLDVSSNQGTINWTQVRNATPNRTFAFVRATQGDDPAFDDRNFASNMTNGRAAGLLMGAYHVGYPNLNPSPISEAGHFVAVAGIYMIHDYRLPATRA